MSTAQPNAEDAKWAGVASVFLIGGALTAIGGAVLGIKPAIDSGALLMASGGVVYIAAAWVWYT